MIDFRTLPPSEFRTPEASQRVDDAIHKAYRSFTDPRRPPNPVSSHYWDEDYRCWLPLTGSLPSSPVNRPSHIKCPPVSLAELFRYIKENYSEEDIRNRYSEIRDALLYSDQQSWAYKRQQSDLTNREVPDILEEQPQYREEPFVSVVLSRSEAEAAYKRAASALAEIDRLEQKYSPDLSDGSVVAFRLTFPGELRYNYAAIRAVGQWFVTGKISSSTAHAAGVGLDWSVLLESFEVFAATDFTVLRTGGEDKELPAGSDALVGRVVVAEPGTQMNAFHSEPTPEDDD